MAKGRIITDNSIIIISRYRYVDLSETYIGYSMPTPKPTTSDSVATETSSILKNQRVVKGKGSPITSKGRRRAAGFYAHHFSVSHYFDGGAYLLSVANQLDDELK